MLMLVQREYVSLGQKDFYITPSHSWPARQNAADLIDMNSKFVLLLLAALQVCTELFLIFPKLLNNNTDVLVGVDLLLLGLTRGWMMD